MGGKCSPSGGINPPVFGQRLDTKDKKESRSGKPKSRTDLYPDENHMRPEDKIMSRWFDEDGWAFYDRDYSDHGHPDAHPVPHDNTFNWKHRLGIPERSTKWFEPNSTAC